MASLWDDWNERGAEKPAAKPRGLWDRFIDNFNLGAVDSPWGAEGVVRATSKLPAEELNRRERVVRDKLIKKGEDDPAHRPGSVMSGQEGALKALVDTAGGIIGSVDPTWVLNPGKGIIQRAASQAGINAVVDASGQGVQVKRGVRDEYDPLQTAINAGAGAGLSVGSDLISKSRAAKAIARGGNLTLAAAKDIGNKFGTVTSTTRTPERNKKVGGAKNSYHLRGQAIDIARGKGVNHKQLERAYRRAGYDIIESLDEGDHSHFAFRFGKGKPVDPDPVAPYAPPLDSSHEKFTPYVERLNDPMNDIGPESDIEFLLRMDDPERGMNEADVKRLEELLTPKEGPSKSILDDVLTPAEKQEMDASAVRPDVIPITPKGLGLGDIRDPANDPENIVPMGPERETKKLKDFHKDFMGEVRRRAKEAQETGQRYHEEGKLPYKIGDKFTTEHGRSRGEEPWEVIGYSVDPKDPEKYGYHVQRGKKGKGDDDPNSTYERSVLSRSNPAFDKKMMNDPKYKERTGKDWVPLSERTDWQLVGKPKLSVVKTLKDIKDDDSGAFRPFGRDPGSGERVPLSDLEPEERLVQLLKRMKPMTGEQRSMYKAERGRRAGYLSKLQAEDATRENIHRQLGSQKGQLPKKAFASIAEHFSDEDFVRMANRINHSPTLLQFQKLNANKAFIKLMDPEAAKLPTPSEIKLLSEVYGSDFVEAVLANRTFLQKAWHNTKSGLNIPRAIMSSMDFSAPFRQGIGLVHKKEFWQALPHMFKMWASEAKSKDWINSVKSHPRWQQAHDAGLAITDPHTHFLADKEEEFMTDLAERLPFGVGKMISASNRAYSGFLNKLRWDTFNNLLDQREAMGDVIDDKALKQMGKFINMATGRGDLGKTGNKAAPALSAMLFSPRLIASRVKTLASPVTYLKADPQVRKEAWKSLFAMSAYYMTLGGIAKYLLGMDVETDPRSADFMKAKIGNTRYDFMAGYGQYIRLGAQLITDSTITGKGEETDLTSNEGYRAPTRRDVAIKFFLNKLAPVPGLVSDWMEGSDPTGEPFTWKNAVATRMLPMASQDIADAIKEWGPIGAAMGLPGLGGWSVQTYKPKPPKEKEQEPMTLDNGEDGGAWSEWNNRGQSSDAWSEWEKRK